jgi:hypothetical protein
MKTSMSDLADAVFREIQKDELEKAASIAYTEKKPLNSEAGKLLMKVAQELRNPTATEISYADLAKYRKNNAR